MYSSTESPVRSVVNVVDSNPESPEVKGPWLPDQAELGSKSTPWYEEKSSNLRSSDIPFIKENGGMFDKFEVVIPCLEERAHLPPRGFHTFYINQLEMGLYERMGKTAMLKALEEAETGSTGAAAPPTKVEKKRKASAEKKARHQRKKKGASTSEARPAPIVEKSRASMPPITMTEERPDLTPVITIPEASSPERGPTKEAGPGRVPPLASHEPSERRGTSDGTSKTRPSHPARAAGGEKEALEAEKVAMRLDLDETKSRAEEKIGCLRSEATNAWDLRKEEFLNSSEFDTPCANKSLAYFNIGFESCVAQFRANGYSEEEHPDPILDVNKALQEMPDDDEEAEDEAEEDASGDEATPQSSPQQ
ncbi:hypothetical protein F511_32952 [Dorcoceras hygrometricum]|uniref:Uncharacterized protein n=1 Tax=Dorcoceras hygrometricum TaxID=472368 RepID=A0A2Z7C5D4_9LAMI|nr:hypothetical protein F511_32952 [Dorcoceras hygrometricum]